MVTEEHTGTASPGVLNRQLLVAKAIHMARQMGFSDLYRELIGQGASPGLAWGIGLRLKRGLSHPGEPGVYAKDSVYLTGRMRVRAWLNAGGDIGHLYVGKVGTHHPVDDWLNQGWVQPAPLPPSWMASTGS